ncbi:FAD-dependent oxidoreductase [Kitasatospora sp. NPDC101157]|uniref:FAD-dependent oxidoreductase n=1 Tax=Kitasatospora sp. NPDC101157 TaxID=3364098 RepID=UPI0037F6BBCD
MPSFNEKIRRWRLAVIGGGSAAAVQVRQGDVPPQETIVIGARWGTGMEFLGNFILQSYVEELQVSDSPGGLRSVVDPGQLRPSASQFDGYVRDSLMSSGAVLKQGRVLEIEGTEGAFLIHVLNGDGTISYVCAESVVLATGSAPRQPSRRWAEAGAVSHEVVHADIAQRRTERWAGRSVIVVGAGNSGMQAAALVAPDAAEVVLLGNRYVGMFPTENPDRFAWRAPSQLTYELVGKSALECGERKWRTPCVRHLVYDGLDVEGGRVSWTYSESRNQNPLGSRSLPGRCRHAQAAERTPSGPADWRESRDLARTTVVWATGNEPVFPGGELVATLVRDDKGALAVDEFGATSTPGVFALGACAGQPSVNETTPALVRAERRFFQRSLRPAGATAAKEVLT